MNLNQLEKCGYFCLKFLKQIINHFNAQLANRTLKRESDTKSVLSIDSDNSSTMDFKVNNTPEILNFISCLLEILYEIFQAKNAANSTLSCSNTYSSSSQSQLFDSFGMQDVVWLMYQLVLIFFENQEVNALYFQQTFRPLKVFFIIFECMASCNSKFERVKYLSLVHNYLAK